MKQESSRESLVSLLLPLALILGLVLLSRDSEQTYLTIESIGALERWLRVTVGYLAAGAEIAAAVVIGGAIARGISNYIRQFFSRRQRLDVSEVIRLQLGRGLALGLEFTIASDILRSGVAPTRQDISNLAAIVLLRTLLNYFLAREIRQGEANRLSEKIDL
ncbi:DUF1622 domain-containing protein [Myxosarcina sp. GI1]|uniref:DUF1622 domain-containing protein n=1 Tax=Myxosarcina sp. GI1 TaxID=1541065 RepID=UPI00055C0B0B|nr:DUF1622 domain-containing protein [Myxosarcina sp. GI1]